MITDTIRAEFEKLHQAVKGIKYTGGDPDLKEWFEYGYQARAQHDAEIIRELLTDVDLYFDEIETMISEITDSAIPPMKPDSIKARVREYLQRVKGLES